MHDNAKALCQQLQIELPVIGGAMYPCSNPELVAAISEAGGLGMIQPLSLTYVHGYDFKEGLQYMRSLTDKPLGLNLLIEKSSQKYLDRIWSWLDIALDEGIRFFVTALGNPEPFSKRVHAEGGLVFHNTTERKWAEKALLGGVDGLICVNDRAGGHAGSISPETLYADLAPCGVPLVSAGGISTPEQLRQALDLGYAGVQMGTRFIASQECTAHPKYKQAIVEAGADDIVLTDKLSGVPVSVIATEFIKSSGPRAGWLARKMLQGGRTKHWMRLFYSLRSFRSLKQASKSSAYYDHYLQAGKSVDGIEDILAVDEIMTAFAQSLK